DRVADRVAGVGDAGGVVERLAAAGSEGFVWLFAVYAEVRPCISPVNADLSRTVDPFDPSSIHPKNGVCDGMNGTNSRTIVLRCQARLREGSAWPANIVAGSGRRIL